jgi:hypothetical protein
MTSNCVRRGRPLRSCDSRAMVRESEGDAERAQRMSPKSVAPDGF